MSERTSVKLSFLRTLFLWRIKIPTAVEPNPERKTSPVIPSRIWSSADACWILLALITVWKSFYLVSTKFVGFTLDQSDVIFQDTRYIEFFMHEYLFDIALFSNTRLIWSAQDDEFPVWFSVGSMIKFYFLVMLRNLLAPHLSMLRYYWQCNLLNLEKKMLSKILVFWILIGKVWKNYYES